MKNILLLLGLMLLSSVGEAKLTVTVVDTSISVSKEDCQANFDYTMSFANDEYQTQWSICTNIDKVCNYNDCIDLETACANYEDWKNGVITCEWNK